MRESKGLSNSNLNACSRDVCLYLGVVLSYENSTQIEWTFNTTILLLRLFTKYVNGKNARIEEK